MEGGDPVVIQNSEGARTTPSIVAFTAKGETLIGQFAKNQAITNAVNTIRSAKRFIGRRLNECESEMKHVSYKVIRSGNEGVKFETSAGEFTPQEISARVLMKMKQTAEDYLGQKVTKAELPFRLISMTNNVKQPKTREELLVWKWKGSSTNQPRPLLPTALIRKM